MGKITSLKGTRDFYPELRFYQNYIFDVWRRVSKRFGYEEYEGPLLESAKLWEMKSGSEIFDQMYVFEDKAGRKIAVRPELTPTLARMVAQKTLPKPIKWFSIGRFWRYENPQKGRFREFYQFNIDCLGVPQFSADAELIETMYEIAKELKIDSLTYVRISNRKIISGFMDDLIENDDIKRDVFRLIDKFEKMPLSDFESALSDLGLYEEQINKINEFLKTDNLSSLLKLCDNELFVRGCTELKIVLDTLKEKGIADFVRFDPKIFRGFDYYTSTVFELFDKSKKYRAIAGGGRYDDLVAMFNSPKIEGVGYAFGDAVLLDFLAEHSLLPEYESGVDIFITSECSKASEIARLLRVDFNVETELIGRSLKSQLKYADKRKIPFVILHCNDKLRIKNLRTSEEFDVEISSVREFFIKYKAKGFLK